MSKATVTRLFVASLIAALAGLILMVVAGSVALANDVFVFEGSEVVDVRPTGIAFGMLGFAIIGGLTILGAAIGGLVSWIGALLNTSQLASKTWFLALLLLGIFNFGIVAMIAYVIAGPSGPKTTTDRAIPAPAPTPA
jgi:hypothetical protein